MNDSYGTVLREKLKESMAEPWKPLNRVQKHDLFGRILVPLLHDLMGAVGIVLAAVTVGAVLFLYAWWRVH